MVSPLDVAQSTYFAPPRVTRSMIPQDDITEENARVINFPHRSSIPLKQTAKQAPSAMVSYLPLTKIQTQSPRGLFHTIYITIEEHRWPLWLVCAIVTLLSARRLLIEQNLHYPLRLYVHQLVVAAAMALYLYQWRRKKEGEQPPRTKSTVFAKLLVASAHCFIALSMTLTMQAVLHFTNLPVLLMMTTIAYFVEGLLLLAAGCRSASRTELLRLCLLAPAVYGVVAMEYRLGLPNIMASVPAMVCAGIASALKRIVAHYYPDNAAETTKGHAWLIGMGCLVVILWVAVPKPEEYIRTIALQNVPLLALNAVSGAATMLIGGSTLIYIDSHPKTEPRGISREPLLGIRDVLTLLLLTSITGCSSNVSIRRSYMSWQQLGCFLLGALCVGSRMASDSTWSQLYGQSITPATYELVSESSSSASDNEIATTLIEDLEVTQPQIRQSKQGSLGLYTILVSIAVVTWICYVLLNFTERVYPRFNPILDRGYTASVPLEVVIAMYAEPIQDVNELISNMKSIPAFSEAKFTIYFKGEKTDQKQVEQQSGADAVIARPNVGREAETYLHHILTKWDSLATQTVFLQADVHNSREFYPRLSKYFRQDRTGFLSLGWSGSVCDCESCGDKFYWRDDTHLLPILQQQINSAATCDKVLLSYKGQFAVSAARIRGINQAIYENLWHAFVDEKSWAHQDEYLQGRADSMSQPLFGYTMERLWNMLFQCSDMEVAWKCPTLVSGWRAEGDISDCQCFD